VQAWKKGRYKLFWLIEWIYIYGLKCAICLMSTLSQCPFIRFMLRPAIRRSQLVLRSDAASYMGSILFIAQWFTPVARWKNCEKCLICIVVVELQYLYEVVSIAFVAWLQKEVVIKWVWYRSTVGQGQVWQRVFSEREEHKVYRRSQGLRSLLLFYLHLVTSLILFTSSYFSYFIYI